MKYKFQKANVKPYKTIYKALYKHNVEHILWRITHSVFRTQVAEIVHYVHVHYALEPIKNDIWC